MLLLTSMFATAAPLPEWMAGCWETSGPTSCREVWQPPKGDVMVASVVCELENGVEIEHVTLREVEGVLVYEAHPSSQPAHGFPEAERSQTSITFADPKHDFPQEIAYRMVGEHLVAEVSGTPPGRDPFGFELDFTRCDSPDAGDAEETPLTLRGAPPDELRPLPCGEPDAWVSKQLAMAAKTDQKERLKRDYLGIAERDQIRLAMVEAALDTQRVCSAEDAWNAGVVLQHGHDPQHFVQGYHLFRHACEAGNERACKWVRLAWDRALVSSGSPQWFGTQYRSDGEPEPGKPTRMCFIEMDPDSDDASRARYGGAPLSQVAEQVWERRTGSVPDDASFEALHEAGWVCPAVAWPRRDR